MCRLMALKSTEPVPMYRFLIGGDNAFAVQSLEHPDGWGIAYHEGDETSLVKSVLPAITDELFEEVAFSVKATTVLAHVRRATAGVVARRNCHPFRRGPWAFAHNGKITGFDQVKDALKARIDPALRASLEGETDTEVFFLLFLTHLESLASLDDRQPPTSALAKAMSRTLAEVRAVADQPSAGGAPVEASSLTCIATTGAVMLATSNGKPLSVRRSVADGTTRQVMLSSEAISTPGLIRERFPWRELVTGEYLVVDRELAMASGSL